MRTATVLGGPIQTGTLISCSCRGGARLGSTLRPACVQTGPDYPTSAQATMSVPYRLATVQRPASADRADRIRERQANIPRRVENGRIAAIDLIAGPRAPPPARRGPPRRWALSAWPPRKGLLELERLDDRHRLRGKVIEAVRVLGHDRDEDNVALPHVQDDQPHPRFA